MLDMKTKSALLAGAFAVFVGPAYAQAVGDAPMTDPATDEQPMTGEAETMDTAPDAAADMQPEEPVQQAAPAQPQADPATISRIQEALNDAGHDAGAVDGVWGPQSRSAMTSFQQAQGIDATGLINVRSLEALGLSDVAADLQGTIGTGQAGVGAPEPAQPGAAQPGPGVAEPAPGAAPATEPAPGVAEPVPGVQPSQPGVPPTAATQPPSGPPAAAQQAQPTAPLPDTDGSDVGGGDGETAQ